MLLLDNSLVGIAGFVMLLILICLRFPIALALFIVGVIGNIILGGLGATLGKFYADPYYAFSSHYLAVIPLFLLMGQFAFHSGMSHSVFRFARNVLGARQLGGATIVACGLFSSICGSSLATAATMSKVALPEMLKENYSRSLAAGIVAAGGTLGTLIPPSIVLIIYAILTEQNLVKMFQAALIPGVIAMLGYILVCLLMSYFSPSAFELRAKSGSTNKSSSSAEQLGIFSFLIIAGITFGGIYIGLFTPTEGASIGCLLSLVVGIFTKKLPAVNINKSLKETALTSALIYMILLGASFFSGFLALSGLPSELANWISVNSFNPYAVLIIILCVYLVMGCLMDTISMLILTLPLFFPIVQALDFSGSSANLTPQEIALWFGVLVLVTVEVGLITPPLGLNIFVITSVHKDIRARDCYKGIIPFLISDFFRIILLISLPGLSLFLVRLL